MLRSRQPEFLLLYGELSHGGIETLIVRIANAFIESGVPCTVMCRGGTLTHNLNAAVSLIIYESDSDAHNKLLNRHKHADPRDLIVITFDPTTCALALWLDGIGAFGLCRHLTGVFHPRAYFLDGEDRLRFWLNRTVLQSMPDTAVFFMNNETHAAHAGWSDRRFANSPILPLGIAKGPARWQPSKIDRLKIVSVGRLVGFKAYNFGAITITRRLLESGIDTQWHLYGTGELEEQLRSRVSETNLVSHIIFHGDLPYAEFATKVPEHDVFVGMGTAALEAAMLGMPVLLAVDGEEDATYGFIQDVPFGNVGERLAKTPHESLTALLQIFHGLNAADQNAIGNAGRTVALQYDLEHYCARLIDAGLVAQRPNLLRAWLVGTLYRQATTGLARRLASWIWRRVRFRKKRQ